MKANELMIGDFVLDGNDYAQVTSITCDGNIETTHNEHSNIELIEPIPLTPEILEKNGFEKVQSIYFLKSLNKRYPYLLFIEYNIVNNCLFINDGLIPMPILYVHQLQHVLRLCGIEKEVEL